MLNLRYIIVRGLRLRFGHYVTSGSGPYLSGGIGCRIALGQGALNVKVAYTRYEFKYEQYESLITYKLVRFGTSLISMPEFSYYYSDYKNSSDNLTFTIGYEF